MISREFLCDHQYLGALTCRERWPISSGMAKKGTSLAKALIAVALYGTADLSRRAVEAVPFVQ